MDPRKFLHGERLFYRLLRFWRLLSWPAPGTADAGGSVTWVELVLFYELLAGTELPHWESGVPGGQRGHYRYAEDGPERSPATVQDKAQLLASATWALEALVGHVVPADAKRPPNTWSRSFYTSGGLAVFGYGSYEHGMLPGLRRRPRLPLSSLVYDVLLSRWSGLLRP